MERPRSKLAHCTVSAAEKLPPDVGGAEAICSAIRSAIGSKAPGAAYEVQVVVTSASSLEARLTFEDGRTLPEQRLAVNDRQLNPGSIGRFAAAIADAVARNAGQ